MACDEIPTAICAAAVFLLCAYQTEVLRTLRDAWSRCRCHGKRNQQQSSKRATAITTSHKHEVQFDEGCLKPFTMEHTVLPRSAGKRKQLLATPTAYRRRQAVSKNGSCCDLTHTSCEDDSSSGRPWRTVETSRVSGSIIEVDMHEMRDVSQTERSETSPYSTSPRRHFRSTPSLGSAAMSSVSKNVRRKMLGREKGWTASPNRTTRLSSAPRTSSVQ